MNIKKEDYPNYVLTRNWIFIVLFNAMWALGNPFINVSTTITAYFAELEVPPYIYGLLSLFGCLPVLIQILPQCCNFGSKNPRIPIYITYTVTGVGYVVYGFIAGVADKNPGLYVPLLLAVYFVISCSYRLAQVMYLNYLTMIFPSNYLGRVYGVVGFGQALASVVSGFVILPLILNKWSFPKNYGLLFAFAGFVFLLSIQLFLFTKKFFNPQSRKPSKNIRDYFAYVKSVSGKPEVRKFCILLVLIMLGNTSVSFILPYLRQLDNIKLDTNMLRSLTLVSYCSQAVLMPLMGMVLDKLGSRFTISIFMVIVAAANLLLLVPVPGRYFPIYMAFGMYGLFISMTTVRLAGEIIDEAHRFDAIIITTIISVLASACLSAVCGMLATFFGGYEFIFVICAAFSLGVLLISKSKTAEMPKPETKGALT